MESLLTQGLIGLVFVLSIALWSKSGSNNSSKSGSSATAKKTKKKKKGTTPAQLLNTTAPSAIEPTYTPLDSAQKKREDVEVKAQEEVFSKASHPVPNGAKKSKKANGRKMTLEDFANKTNEERVEELEKMARGDAGEVDIGRDMIDRELQPERTYKKVARIQSALAKKPFERVHVDDGWENVSGKAKGLPAPVVSKKLAEDAPTNAWASSNPFALLPGSGAEVIRPVFKSNGSSSSTPRVVSTTPTNTARSIPGAGDTQTKKQRQNAAKAQAKKQEKEAAEVERLAKLAQHKRQVEAERIKEAFKKQNTPSAPFSIHKGTNNGAIQAKASINEKGSLVWE